MELLNQIASSLLLQIAVFTTILFAVIGLWQVFMTPSYIQWPWLKRRPIPSADADSFFRKGRAAGLFYYCTAIDRHGLNRVSTYMKDVHDSLQEIEAAVPQEHWPQFNAGVLEGQTLGNNIVLQARMHTLTNYFPDLQERLTKVRQHIGAVYAQTPSESMACLKVAMDELDKLRGESK